MSLKDIGFGDFKAEYIAWGILFFCIACVWCTGIALILKYGFGLSKDWLTEIKFNQPYHPILMLIAVVIVGPLTEECLFRGLYLTIMKEKMKLWIAGLTSAVLFAAYYYYLTGLTGAFLILFWSPLPMILFVWKKSIYPGIVLHMVNNLFPYVVIKLLSDLTIVKTLSRIGIL